MTDEELKALVASNAQAIQANTQAIQANVETIQANAQMIQANAQGIAELKVSMQRSYEDMVQMLTQFAEEAAADRQAIRDMVAAMFKHQSNGGSNS